MIDQSRRQELSEELDEEFLDELTAAFWVDAWALIDFGVEALVNDDTDELHKVLHTLAGSAINLGFTGIWQAASAAGAALKIGVRPDFGRLQAVMLRTSAALEAAPAQARLHLVAVSA